MSDEEKDQNFKVKDRRRFDSTGNERDDAENPNASAAKPSSATGPAAAQQQKASQPPPSASKAASPEEDEEGINFSSFVVSLATQALMQLGEMKPPPGVQVTVDLAAAKQTIDILALIETKTKGNLDPDEQRLMTEILHNLRLSFLRGTERK